MLVVFNLLVISESNSTEQMNEIRIHSNKLTSMSTCTLNELHPPELSHILRKDSPHLDSMKSIKFPMNDVFECVLPINDDSTLSKNRLLAIFGMFIQSHSIDLV